MPSLTTLRLDVAADHATTIGKQLQSHALSLPTVKTLVLGPSAEFLIARCPNATTISSSSTSFVSAAEDWSTPAHSTKLIAAAAAAGTRVRHFELHTVWGTTAPPEPQQIAAALPHLVVLAIGGNLYSTSLAPVLAPLAQLAALRVLALPAVDYLSAGLVPEHRRRFEDHAARIVFARLGALEKVWIGERACARALRLDSGVWTGELVWERGKRRERPCEYGWRE